MIFVASVFLYKLTGIKATYFFKISNTCLLFDNFGVKWDADVKYTLCLNSYPEYNLFVRKYIYKTFPLIFYSSVCGNKVT